VTEVLVRGSQTSAVELSNSDQGSSDRATSLYLAAKMAKVGLDIDTAKPYIRLWRYEYDPDKDVANRAKHGVPLALGAVVLENRIGEVLDDRLDYGEARVNAFGLVEQGLFVCTDTMRNETHRLISVRKASRQEQRSWLS
jgi:hypothetical protein